MRYLRILTNAVIGGALGATYLAVLVLQLNPQVPVVSFTAVRWLLALIAFYGPYITGAIYLMILVREVLSSRPLRPAWLSVRLLAWVGTCCAAAACAMTWANLRSLRAVMSEGAAARMHQGAVSTTIFALVLLSVAVLRYSFGRRGGRTTTALLLVSLAASVMVPLWLRGPGEQSLPPRAGSAMSRLLPERPSMAERKPRVRLILLDAAALGFIRQRVATGQLPNFGKLLDRGAALDLATLRPTQAEPIWASASTGKYPPKTGVRSNARYRVRPDDSDPVDLLPDYCFASALAYQGFVREEYLTSASLMARPLWDILADAQLVPSIVNWPLTFPAHVERGYIVSDRFDEASSSPLRAGDAQAAYPSSAARIARDAFDLWQAKPWQEVLPSTSAGETEPGGFPQARWDPAYSETSRTIEQEFAPGLSAVRYVGLDLFGHTSLRDAQPEVFGQTANGTRGRSILDRYYAYIDGEIGAAMAATAPSDLLLVVSGFGMEPVTLTKRLLSRVLGWPDRSGTHESAPDGFLLAYGTNVAHAQYPRGSIVDLAPTVLYYLGLPVGRDMDGLPRTDLFFRSYTSEHAITYIATHER